MGSKILYRFTLDDVDYEADVTVTAGREATGPTMEGPGDPPEGAEIELEHIWLVINRKRNAELPHDSEEYAFAEEYMLNCNDDILEQDRAEADESEMDAADEHAERYKEGF